MVGGMMGVPSMKLPFPVLFALPLLLAAPMMAAEPGGPFVIQVVDAATDRPVPLVRLRTVHEVEYFTDNEGLVAFDEPGLMNQRVYFQVTSHGYTFPKDGFGMAGTRLLTKPGETATIKVERQNLAERIGRITGAGRYEHTARCGRPLPAPDALLNAGVLGSDSVHNAVFEGKLFWLWGDTNRASYPLGNFQTTMATSPLLPGRPGASANPGLSYFTGSDGFVKAMAAMPGEGPTWLSALVTLKDAAGKEHLCATYAKVKAPLTVYERGLCEFAADKSVFEKILTFPPKAVAFPDGHPFPHQTEDGREWMYFGEALPQMRLPANYESWRDPRTYEPVTPDVAFTSQEDGRKIISHNGCLMWNEYRHLWLSIFTELHGRTSELGDIWVAEAPSPEGPWRKAVQVLQHDHYSFYNPKWHPYWSENGGQIVYFEGTYTATFSGNLHPTPRYDYNQILYRLDLQDLQHP